MDIIERDIYAVICKNDGIKAKNIGKMVGRERSVINHYLYGSPYIKELCYQDNEYNWHGLIRQTRPHHGLEDFSGYYSDVDTFLKISYEEWFEALKTGCRNIGRNLNDTRGLFHSFEDAYYTMKALFEDLKEAEVSEKNCGDGNYPSWEIVFELRIKKARFIRIYADVLVITGRYVFALEFKMKDEIEDDDVKQAAKYNEYLEVLFGPEYEVISGLVLTTATDMYEYVPIDEKIADSAQLPVCSGDMLFNIFNEYLGFYS